MKYYEALEIYNDICKKVIESPEEWMQFLDASQGIYKYSFKEQLMIAAQRPDATAVADIAFWNKKMGRYVKKNSTGIAVFTEKIQIKSCVTFMIEAIPNYRGTEDTKSIHGKLKKRKTMP